MTWTAVTTAATMLMTMKMALQMHLVMMEVRDVCRFSLACVGA